MTGTGRYLHGRTIGSDRVHGTKAYKKTALSQWRNTRMVYSASSR